MKDPYASLKQGLVGAWIPSLGASGFRLIDRSGYGNHGTLTNMDAGTDWVASEGGLSLDFDGANDFVTCGYSSLFDLATTKTVSAWINARSFDGTAGGYESSDIVNTDNISGVRTWQFNAVDFNSNNDDAVLTVTSFGTGGGTRDLRTSESLLTNRWYHVAFTTPDGLSTVADVRLYVNGVSQILTDFSSGTFGSANSLTSSNPLHLGRRPGPAGQDLHFNGLLDDVRLYTRVLTPSEIRLLASERGIGFKPNSRTSSTFAKRYTYKPPKEKNYSVIVKSSEPDYASLRQGLVGAWCPSLGASGYTLLDRSGYGNHGTLTNMDAGTDWVASGGLALDFDGSDDYVDCGTLNNRSLAYPFAMACWVKNLSTTHPDAGILSKIQHPFDGAMIWYVSGNIHAYWLGAIRATSTISLANSPVWRHVGITWTGARAQVIIDGKVDADSATIVAPAASGDSFRIGHYRAFLNQPRFIAGQIDDARVYDRSLTAAEWAILASERGIGLKPRQRQTTYYQFPQRSQNHALISNLF